MTLVFMIIAWRVWLVGAALLFLNSLSRLVFNPSLVEFKGLALAIPLIVVWPLALFAPKGRAMLLKRVKKL